METEEGGKWRTVARDEFYAAIGPRDVHPRAERHKTFWIDQRTRAVVGISTPGYLAEGPATYRLAAGKEGQ